MRIINRLTQHKYRSKRLRYGRADSYGVVSNNEGGIIIGGGSNVGATVDVYDGLDSYSKTSALSANQGRLLNDFIYTHTHPLYENNEIDIKPIIQAVYNDYMSDSPTYRISVNEAIFNLISDNITNNKVFFCSPFLSSTNRYIVPLITQVIENERNSSYRIQFTIKDVSYILILINSLSQSIYSVEINNYLPISGGDMNDDARIGTNGGGDLYIGNSDNSGWVKMSDLCSQDGSSNWSINNLGDSQFNTIKTNKLSIKGSTNNYVLLGGGRY